MPLGPFNGMGGSGAVPFRRIIDPQQLGMFLNLEQAEMVRIQRYAEAQRFYLGNQWNFQREDGEPLVTINYIRKLVDKSIEFLVAKGFTVNTPEALIEVTLPFLTEVWKYNKQQQFAWKAAITGGVTGDVFVLITYEEPSRMQKRISPYSKGKIKIQLLASEQVYPTWDPLDAETLVAVRIETIYYGDRGINELAQDQRDHTGRQLNTKRFTQIITADQIVEQFHGEQPTVRRNILGEIPLVHWQNLPFPREYYGLSDVQDLIALQREFNEKSTDISDIINYQGSPVTVITGAKAKQLERGPKQLWAIPDPAAKVYNLNLETDLKAANDYRNNLKISMHELSDVPEGSLGRMQPISNTSGTALHTQYQPILAKTQKKRAMYEPGIEQINYFVLRIAQTMGLLTLPFDLCSECGGKIVEVETGKTTKVWVPDPTNPEGGVFLDKPLTMKRCFEIDKSTLEFKDPYEMRLSFVREYGFGVEVREAPFWVVEREMKSGKPSFWDYAADDLLMEKMYQHGLAQHQEAIRQATAVAAQTPTQTPEGAAGPPGVSPMAIPPPAAPVRRTQKLPPNFINVPEEPEQVVVVKRYENPATLELVGMETETMFLVPTGCKKPQYLNPFETEVQFHDALPKDEHLRAQLYTIYQKNQWVDPQWVQDQIPEIAEYADELRKRMRASMGTVLPGDGQDPYSELAPPDQKAAGDATGTGDRSPDTDRQTQETTAQKQQLEVTDTK